MAFQNKEYIYSSIFVLIVSIFIMELNFYLYYFIFLDNYKSSGFEFLFPTFAHVRFFNQYQIWSLPFVSILINNYFFNIFIKKIYLFVSVSWWLMFFCAGSRGAVVSVLFGYLFVLFFYKDLVKDIIKKTFVVASLGLVLYIILFYFIPYLIYYDLDSEIGDEIGNEIVKIRTSSSGRTILWLKAVFYIKDNPFLGIGPMHYSWHDAVFEEINKANHPHNSMLQWGSEWGLISLFLMLLLIFYSYRSWFNKFRYSTLKHMDEGDKQLIIMLTLSSSSAILYSLFSGVIVMPLSQLMGVLVFSMMLGLYHKKRGYLEIKNNLYRVVFFSVAMFYFYLLVPEIFDIFLPKNNAYYFTMHYPRFWLDGNIQ